MKPAAPIIIFALLLLCGNLVGQPQGELRVLFPATETSNGASREWIYSIEVERIGKLPAIDATSPNPPVTVRKAIEAARLDIMSRRSEAKYLTFSQIGFEHSDHGGVDLWWYEVRFYGGPSETRQDSLFTTYILMDGRPLLVKEKLPDKRANKAPEPTSGSVTSRAYARAAPAPAVAHL